MTLVNTPEGWDVRAQTLESSWDVAGWSEAGQTERFLAVLRELDVHRGESVLDFGCGTGRFSLFLPDGVGYYGWDSSVAMRERARQDHHGICVVEELKASWKFDAVVCIGTFNLPGSTGDTWETIERLWIDHHPRILVASLYAGKDERCLRYEADWALLLARTLAAFYSISMWRHNDLMLVLRRGGKRED